jgi:hypothetical protein
LPSDDCPQAATASDAITTTSLRLIHPAPQGDGHERNGATEGLDGLFAQVSSACNAWFTISSSWVVRHDEAIAVA